MLPVNTLKSKKDHREAKNERLKRSTRGENKNTLASLNIFTRAARKKNDLKVLVFHSFLLFFSFFFCFVS